MSEMKKTAIYAGSAVVLALVAFATASRPVTPDAFLDRGEAFFPGFEDPNSALTLEVIEFDEATGAAIPFKVTNQDGLWTIPSHHDYPADGTERLAKTAAGVIGIIKDDFRSDSVSDHEACGVLDPLDDGASGLVGRGKRVTLKGSNDKVLADFIVGKKLENRDGFRFVRLPGEKRIYVAKMDIDLSTKFEDWIEKDLMTVEPSAIVGLLLDDHSIDEQTLSVQQKDRVTLSKSDGSWSMESTPDGEELDTTKVSTLARTIADLGIVGVRPKPAGLTRDLRDSEGGMVIAQGDLRSLQNRGYYMARDGRLMSNEGELQAITEEGVRYRLRLGEVVYGSGAAITAGDETSDDAESGAGENRYLFVNVDLADELGQGPEPAVDTSFKDKDEAEWTDEDRTNKATDDAHDAWTIKIDNARARVQELNQRFADWYYVISGESFDKLDVGRSDLLKETTS